MRSFDFREIGLLGVCIAPARLLEQYRPRSHGADRRCRRLPFGTELRHHARNEHALIGSPFANGLKGWYLCSSSSIDYKFFFIGGTAQHRNILIR